MKEEEIAKVKILIEEFHARRKAQGYAEITKNQTLWALRYFVEHLQNSEEEKLSELTAENLHKFQNRIYTQPGHDKKMFSLVSQTHILVSVRKWLQWLVREGKLLADPSSGIELPRLPERLPRGVMSKKEVEKILNQAKENEEHWIRDRAILELLYSSGIRNKELRHLRVYDVNLAEQEVEIRNGKGGKDRVVPLGAIAGKYVEQYLKEDRPKKVAGNPEEQHLFLTRQGKALNSSDLNRNIIQKYVEKAGIKKHISAHSFRHTCATHLLRGRASLRHIQQLLGHKSLESTQIYTHVEVSDLKKELKRCHPREQNK